MSILRIDLEIEHTSKCNMGGSHFDDSIYALSLKIKLTYGSGYIT